MDDIFNMNPNAGEQGEASADTAQTRVMSPVEAEAKPAGRRRRTERNREQYENADLPVEEAEVVETEQPAEAPVQTAKLHLNAQKPAAPVVPATGTTVVPRFQTRYNPPVPGSVPSQGVPRPASLNIQTPRRPEAPVKPVVAPTVRRPVQAEGYTPVKPLGVSRAVGSEQEVAEKRFGHVPVNEERRNVPMLDDEDEYIEEGKKGGKGLVIVIIALLAVAAIVLGLLLIPADMPGPIGDVKRSIVGMFSGQEEAKEPAAAQSLMASISKDTAPYVVNLSVTTNKSVADVRIADAEGTVLPTTVQTKIDITEDSTVWTLQLTLATEYEGTIHVQINDGETWIDEDDQLKLTTGEDTKLKISDAPVNPLTAVMTAAATATTTLTAGSEIEPTVRPAMEEILEPTIVPATQVPEDDLTEAPIQQDAVLQATATPTLALTPTPTVRVTEVPTPEPTEAPTPEPTPEPTPVPTATPAPTAVPTPRLEAVAAESADPSLITTQKIYNGTKRVDSYQRSEDDLINMPAGDAYLTRPYGVLTFRGNAFRMNAAVGTVTEPTGFAPLWSVPAGSLEAKSRTFYGFSMYSQPVIITWPREIRQAMDIAEERKNQTALKEVIIAGQDGKIYFHDLKDGTATREAIDLGYAMRSTPSLHPLGYPVLTVGQYSNKLPNKTGKTMGLYYYSLINSKQLRLIDGLDGDRDRMYYNVGAFDTSALIDRNSNTLIAVGTNGMLYTEKLDLKFIANNGGIFEFSDVKDQAILMSHTKNQKDSQAAVESSLAMYGSYAFYADMGGVLRCVDTTTMTTVWAVNTGDAVRAAIALDLDEETHTLWLYTANTITNRTKNSDVTIRRFNAMTGEEDWNLAVNSTRKTGKKDAYNKDVTAGAVASPVIGQHGLSDLVYFTLSSVSKTGAQTLLGSEEAIPSVLLALNKETHEIVWAHKMDAYSYSSPLAVYDENGRGWIVQGCSNGTLYLLDGLTGSLINTMQVNGIIEGSPAAYGNTIVFGTTGKAEKSQLHAVTLK